MREVIRLQHSRPFLLCLLVACLLPSSLLLSRFLLSCFYCIPFFSSSSSTIFFLFSSSSSFLSFPPFPSFLCSSPPVFLRFSPSWPDNSVYFTNRPHSTVFRLEPRVLLTTAYPAGVGHRPASDQKRQAGPTGTLHKAAKAKTKDVHVPCRVIAKRLSLFRFVTHPVARLISSHTNRSKTATSKILSRMLKTHAITVA